jgi:hypothetical protein
MHPKYISSNQNSKEGIYKMFEFPTTNGNNGARGGAVVEALHYKPEGRGIDSRWYHCNFSLT